MIPPKREKRDITKCSVEIGKFKSKKQFCLNVRANQLHCFKRFKKFGSKFNLNAHFNLRHNRWKDFTCTECTKEFDCKSDLVQHTKRFHESKQFPCASCSNVFRTKAMLVFHKKTAHKKTKTSNCVNPNGSATNSINQQLKVEIKVE